MNMTFWWGSNVTNYLFKGLSTHSVGGLFGMCTCVATLSFTFEFLRYLQAKQRQNELTLRSEQLKSICPSDTSTLLTNNEATTSAANPVVVTKLDRGLLFGAELSLWFLLQNLGYILMLTVMVYNGWMFVAAVLGGGFGYFIFGQKFMKVNLQNCQIIRDTFCMKKCGEPETVATSRDGESTPALEAATSSGEALHCHEVTVHAECDMKN